MQADPKVGQTYHQEYYKGEAEDMAKVQSLNESVTVPYGSFDHVLVTKEWTPLEPSYDEHKYYAPGVGQVYGGGLELVDVKDGCGNPPLGGARSHPRVSRGDSSAVHSSLPSVDGARRLPHSACTTTPALTDERHPRSPHYQRGRVPGTRPSSPHVELSKMYVAQVHVRGEVPPRTLRSPSHIHSTSKYISSLASLKRQTILSAVSECPGLRLLEEDIQHVRLNVVWVGTDGRCAELERDVQ